MELWDPAPGIYDREMKTIQSAVKNFYRYSIHKFPKQSKPQMPLISKDNNKF